MNKTCNERIGEELQKELVKIKDATKSERKREEYESNILSIDKTLHYKICLSWGGPADYFNIWINPDSKEIDKISYQFQDWFDNAEVYLEGKEFDLVADFFSYLVEV